VLTVVEPAGVQDFLDPLPIRVIPGIGPKTERAFHERGIRTVRDLREVEEPHLAEWFGRWGHDLHAKVRGISDSPVSSEWEPKSVGEQETFEIDTLTRSSSSSARGRSRARSSAGSSVRGSARSAPSP